MRELSVRTILETLLSDEAAGRPLSRAAVDELAQRAGPGGHTENDAPTAAAIDQRRRNREARDSFVAAYPVIGAVLRALGDRLSAWQIALWWTAANGWLEGKCPADVARTEPDLVIDAAQRLADELGPVRVEVVSAPPQGPRPLDWDS